MWSNRNFSALTDRIFTVPRPEGKRVKEVYDNEGLTHAWASENVVRGRSSAMFFENGIIYSFGHHYKAAKIYTNAKGEKLVLMNENNYSSRTSKHLWDIRNAVSHITIIRVPDVDVTDHSDNVAYLENKFLERTENIYSMKGGWYGNGDSVLDEIMNYNAYLKFFGLKGSINTDSEKLQSTFELLTACYEAKKEKSKKIREKKEKNLEYKYQKEQSDLNWNFRVKLNDFLAGKIDHQSLNRFKTRHVVKGYCFGRESYHTLTAKIPSDLISAYEEKLKIIHEEQINSWRSGDLRTLPWDVRGEFALLRVNGNKVETSQGADVPLSHALRLLGLIEKKQVRRGERVGHYTFDRIESLNEVPPVVTIGCHKILLSEAQTVLASYREQHLKLVAE